MGGNVAKDAKKRLITAGERRANTQRVRSRPSRSSPRSRGRASSRLPRKLSVLLNYIKRFTTHYRVHAAFHDVVAAYRNAAAGDDMKQAFKSLYHWIDKEVKVSPRRGHRIVKSFCAAYRRCAGGEDYNVVD